MRSLATAALVFFFVACGQQAAEHQVDSADATDDDPGHSPIDALITTVNSGNGESWLSLHPDGRIALFGRHVDGFSDQRIYMTTWDGASWSAPGIAPFAAEANERGARFSPDGSRVFFSSTRPTSDDDADADFNIWAVDLGNDAAWGQPFPLPGVNSAEDDFHPSVASDGRLFFGSRRAESVGESDMFVAVEGSGGWSVRPIEELNTEFSEPDPYVAADGSFILFARTAAPDGLGGDDLYISYANGGGWSQPRNLGESVNTPEYEYGAHVTADGETLIYTTWASGDAQIAAIAIDSLDLN